MRAFFPILSVCNDKGTDAIAEVELAAFVLVVVSIHACFDSSVEAIARPFLALVRHVCTVRKKRCLEEI